MPVKAIIEQSFLLKFENSEFLSTKRSLQLKKILILAYNVCYIEQYYVFLCPIKYNYGEEHVWKDDAKDIEPEPEDHGRTD